MKKSILIMLVLAVVASMTVLVSCGKDTGNAAGGNIFTLKAAGK